MSANKWFKFYGAEYIGDPKIISLSPAERSCWLTLLCYASLSNGIIEFLTEENLMIMSGLSFQKDEWDETKGILDKFVKLKMIEINNNIINIINWKKRQESYLTGYERVKKFREKKRNDNAMITSDKNRIDKNIYNIYNNKKDNLTFKGQKVRDYFGTYQVWSGGKWTDLDPKYIKEIKGGRQN